MNLSNLRVACSNCNLRELCLPVGLSSEEMGRVEQIVATRRRVRRGEALFRAGDRFESLYAVRLGFLKSTHLSTEGHEQVTGFHMAGEIVGLDGISADSHTCDTTALEDTEVCVIPYDRLEEFAAHPDKVLHILDKGSVQAREVAQKTMSRVREAVFNWKEKRAEIAAPRGLDEASFGEIKFRPVHPIGE